MPHCLVGEFSFIATDTQTNTETCTHADMQAHARSHVHTHVEIHTNTQHVINRPEAGRLILLQPG